MGCTNNEPIGIVRYQHKIVFMKSAVGRFLFISSLPKNLIKEHLMHIFPAYQEIVDFIAAGQPHKI